MSNTNAPVCNVTPPAAPSVTPSVPLPAIPVATNMSTLLAASNAMRQIIQQMTNQTTNTFGVTASKDPQKKKPSPNSGFAEVPSKRTYATVKVSNPQDPTQYVMVKQITGLTFNNPVTKQQIVWKQ